MPGYCWTETEIASGIPVVITSSPTNADGFQGFRTGPMHTLEGSNEYTQPLALPALPQPNRQTTLQASAQGAPLGVAQGSSTALEMNVPAAKPRATTVRAVLRTTHAFIDRPQVRVSFQLRDAYGNVRIRTSGLSVQLSMEESGTGSAITGCVSVGCGLPSSSTGVGTCSCSVASSWFSSATSAEAKVTFKYNGVAVQSDVVAEGSVELTEQPGWWPTPPSLGAAGLYATLPVAPRYASEALSVSVYAHTGVYPLDSWTILVYYDASLLSYSSYSQNADYNPAVVSQNSDATETWVVYSAVGTRGGTSDAAITSEHLSLLTVHFSVKSSAAAGTLSTPQWHASAVRVVADDLINTGAVRFVDDKTATMFGSGESRAQSSSSGALSADVPVVAPTVTGLFAYTTSATLTNMAPLDGSVAASYPISGVRVYDRYSKPDGALSSNDFTACTSTSAAVGLQSCSVQLGTEQTAGDTAAVVNVSLNALSAAVPLSIWYPDPVELHATDTTLDRIVGIGSCGAPAYQQTEVVVRVNGVDWVDVSSVTTLAVSDASVAELPDASNVVRGLSAGSVVVYVAVSPWLAARNETILVSDASPVSVTALTARLASEASWKTPTPSSLWDDSLRPGGGFNVTAILTQTLTAEGHTATLYTVAHFSDGTSQEVGAGVSALSNLSLTASAGPPLSNGVGAMLFHPPTGNAKPLWTVEVAFGATWQCGPLIQVDWRVCGATIATGEVRTLLAMPTPMWCNISASHSPLASPSNDAVEAPMSKPTSALVTVSVSFDDGSSRDFTVDPRTNWTVGESCGSFTGGGTSPRVHTVDPPIFSHPTEETYNGTVDCGRGTIQSDATAADLPMGADHYTVLLEFKCTSLPQSATLYAWGSGSNGNINALHMTANWLNH